MLDKNCKKVLKFFIKNNSISSYEDLSSHFSNHTNMEIIDIISSLCDGGYIRDIGDDEFILTNKGSTYSHLTIKEWLSNNLLAIIAIIISIIALFN